MKKHKIIYVIILSFSTLSILYGLNINNTKLVFQEANKYQKYSYYKSKNKKRYIQYEQKNKNLKSEDIIIQVNIGLDKPYYTNVKENKKLNDQLILVNKYMSLPKDYIPNNLEIINEKYSLKNMKLVNYAKIAFEQMAEDASKEKLKLIAMSTYRSYDYQENLYTKYLNQDGKELADTYSARPGHSEHQTGLAVDIYNQEVNYTNFENTKEFEWLKENSYKYGFILRYPKNKSKITGYIYEPWHYRYVGIDTATKIYNEQITYEEYYMKYLDK